MTSAVLPYAKRDTCRTALRPSGRKPAPNSFSTERATLPGPEDTR